MDISSWFPMLLRHTMKIYLYGGCLNFVKIRKKDSSKIKSDVWKISSSLKNKTLIQLSTLIVIFCYSEGQKYLSNVRTTSESVSI